MQLLIIGSGAVGDVVAKFIMNRGENKWLSKLVIADCHQDNIDKTLSSLTESSIPVIGRVLDASNKDAIIKLCQEEGIDTVFDASPPFLAEIIFDAAYEANCHFLNMGTWSLPKHQLQEAKPAFEVYEPFMAKYHLEKSENWQEKNLTGIICVGIDPGVVNVFVNYAKHHLFDEIHEVHVRDGSDISSTIPTEEVSFGFNVWTVLDECLNPSVTWDTQEGYMAHPPFSGEELFSFPENIGMQKVYQIEHEEVYLFAEYLKKQGLKKCTYKIALDDDLVNALKTIEQLGLRSLEPVTIGGKTLKKRDILAKLLPQPSGIDDSYQGKMCVGVKFVGVKDSMTREVFLYQTYDQMEAIKDYQSQAVVAQTGIGAGIAIELMARGLWSKRGVYGPESFDAVPYMKIMQEVGYAFDLIEQASEYSKLLAKDNFKL